MEGLKEAKSTNENKIQSLKQLCIESGNHN